MSTAPNLYIADSAPQASVELRKEDLLAFRRGENENRKFWSRFGQRPDLDGATVLDVGSGWGKLCVDVALSGAKKVVGLEIKPELVDFSQEIVRQQYPRLQNRVEFLHCDLRDYSDEPQFDFIISKDSFEHIIDLDSMLLAMKKRLRPGGRIYAGFGPLYTSPYGDHDRREVAFAAFGPVGKAIAKVPWLHIPLEQVVISLHNQRHGKNVHTVQDLGLNGLSISDYRRAFHNSGLVMVDMRVNQSGGLSSRVLSAMAKVPVIEDYCVHNVYCILEKR